jgi:hypothetical protein
MQLSKTYKLKLYPVPKPKKNQLLAEEMSVLEGWLNYVGRQEGIYSTETFKQVPLPRSALPDIFLLIRTAEH